MKRKIILIPLALLLVVSLIACAAPAPAPAPGPATTTTVTAPAPAPAPGPTTTVTAPAPAPVPAPLPEPKTFKFASFAGEGFPLIDYWERPFLSLVEERTKDTINPITFDIYPSGQLLAGGEMIDGVQMGIADFGQVAGHPTRFPLGSVFNLPYVFSNDTYEANWMTAADLYRRSDTMIQPYVDENIRIVMTMLTTNRLIFIAHPIDSVSDLVGKKLRSFGLEAETLAAVGIVSSFMELTDATMGMKTGVVSGFSQPWWAAGSFSIPELTEHVADIGNHFLAVSNVGMNEEQWQRLDPEVQNIIIESAKEIEAQWQEKQVALNEEIRQEYFADTPVTTITDAELEEWKSKTQFVIDTWMENEGAEELWNELQILMKYYTAELGL